MWKFLFTEFDWTEFVTNTLALMFGTMTVVVIIYAAIFAEDKEMLAAVGSVTSGITGVILGYYFNRSRLHQAQNQADEAVGQLRDMERDVQDDRDLRSMYEALKTQYDVMNEAFADLLAETETLQAEQEGERSG